MWITLSYARIIKNDEERFSYRPSPAYFYLNLSQAAFVRMEPEYVIVGLPDGSEIETDNPSDIQNLFFLLSRQSIND